MEAWALLVNLEKAYELGWKKIIWNSTMSDIPINNDKFKKFS